MSNNSSEAYLHHADNLNYLSDSQEKLIAVLPIPSAILSILGSASIIYMVCRRKDRRYTPYTRLLVAMSAGDIVYSLSLSIGSFMKPRETSHKSFAFGNEATCTASGFLSQLARCALLYNGMLSFYFLLVARFGMKSQTIARYVEPFMHLVAFAYPLVTAAVGAVYGFYAEPEFGFGCWVNDYPRGCGDGPGKTGEECRTYTIGWLYGALPFLFVFFSLIINNLIIWCFVRRQVKPQSNPVESQTSTDSDFELESISSKWQRSGDVLSVRMASDTAKSIVADDREENRSLQKAQLKRLKLVRSQALLFVGSYFVCNLCWGLIIIIESGADSTEEEVDALSKYYAVVVLNAIFLPLQGFLNLFVFIRPKYLKTRSEFPLESRLWAFNRVVHGDRVKRSKQDVMIPQKMPSQDAADKDCGGHRDTISTSAQGSNEFGLGKRNCVDESDDVVSFDQHQDSLKPLHNEALRVSSISASTGDFDEEDLAESTDRRWDTAPNSKTWTPMKESRRSRGSGRSSGLSQLESISELTEMSFAEPVESHDSADDALRTPWEHVKRRWSVDSMTQKKAPGSSESGSSASKLSMPIRVESQPRVVSESDFSLEEDNEMESDPFRTSERSSDSPIRAPARRPSPPPVPLEP